jgi:hypothetical protein
VKIFSSAASFKKILPGFRCRDPGIAAGDDDPAEPADLKNCGMAGQADRSAPKKFRVILIRSA